MLLVVQPVCMCLSKYSQQVFTASIHSKYSHESGATFTLCCLKHLSGYNDSLYASELEFPCARCV